MTYVVDTSVVIKWVVREEGSEQAAALIGEEIVAPDLLRAECANAFWKKVRKREISEIQAIDSLLAVTDLVPVVSSDGLAMAALAIGIELGRPVYDCFFLALAETLDAELVTADLRLVETVAGTRFAQRVRPLLGKI